jgi:protein SCO1/2/putative membrane protein
MGAATLVSSVFLACYLTYHIEHGERSTHLSHAPHWLRTIYLCVLLPHLFLAVAMLPMIVMTLLRAWRRDWVNHPRIARPTFWIWMYVSVSGVVVYLLLYHTALNS